MGEVFAIGVVLQTAKERSMNERKDTIKEMFKPFLALIAHKSNVTHSYYLESHTIDESGRIMEGKPLLQETLQSMVDVFFDENQNRSSITGLLPEGLLYYQPLPGGYYKMIWHRPAEVRFLHFSGHLKISSGQSWVPPMIYLVDRKELSVFCVKTNSRPKEATKLFRAPFHNVGDSGSVCLGSATVKKPSEKTFDSTLKYWEDLFWLSEFSHLNGATNPTKSALGKVWAKLIKSKQKLKWSDLDELKEASNKTLKSLFK